MSQNTNIQNYYYDGSFKATLLAQDLMKKDIFKTMRDTEHARILSSLSKDSRRCKENEAFSRNFIWSINKPMKGDKK